VWGLKEKGRAEALPLVSPFKLNLLTARCLFCLRPERRPERTHPLRVKRPGKAGARNGWQRIA